MRGIAVFRKIIIAGKCTKCLWKLVEWEARMEIGSFCNVWLGMVMGWDKPRTTAGKSVIMAESPWFGIIVSVILLWNRVVSGKWAGKWAGKWRLWKKTWLLQWYVLIPVYIERSIIPVIWSYEDGNDGLGFEKGADNWRDLACWSASESKKCWWYGERIGGWAEGMCWEVNGLEVRWLYCEDKIGKSTHHNYMDPHR